MSLGPRKGSLLRRPTAFVPLLMSLSAIAMFLGYVAVFGVNENPDGDEGFAAHTFQLILVAQIPLIAAFAGTWIRRYPWKGAAILAAQLGAIVAALATVIFFES